jgi:hypothetical protein
VERQVGHLQEFPAGTIFFKLILHE